MGGAVEGCDSLLDCFEVEVGVLVVEDGAVLERVRGILCRESLAEVHHHSRGACLVDGVLKNLLEKPHSLLISKVYQGSIKIRHRSGFKSLSVLKFHRIPSLLSNLVVVFI